MNTLVIGNGFDLAHDLPTQYKDFMNFFQFCEAILSLDDRKTELFYVVKANRNIWKSLKRKMRDYIRKIYKKKGEIISIVPPFIVEYYDKGNRNCWYEYYKAILTDDSDLVKEHFTIAGDNWVDFEKEISRVVSKIERDSIIETTEIERGSSTVIIDLKDYYEHISCDKGKEIILYIRQKHYVFKHMKEFISHLRKELDVFINFMDSYIMFIRNMEIEEKLDDFEENGSKILFHRVISFNYSDTFEHNYKLYIDNYLNPKHMEETIEYAHGKAGEEHEQYISNLVLGCEETLQDNKSSKDTRCAYFKKYMQREIKNTATKYSGFYNEKDCNLIYEEDEFGNKYQTKTAYFFGHSLDVNDGDIIKFVIDNNDNVVIFYYDYDDCIAKINNLITILTKEEYLKNRNKFEYRPQKKKKTK